MAKHVDYYVSLNSPWTYLGSKRFEAMAQKHGADVTIWPVDFGSVFAVSGGLPLPKRAPQRQAYRMMELKRWRDQVGVKLNLEPKFFPSNEVPAAKCVKSKRPSKSVTAVRGAVPVVVEVSLTAIPESTSVAFWPVEEVTFPAIDPVADACAEGPACCAKARIAQNRIAISTAP